MTLDQIAEERRVLADEIERTIRAFEERTGAVVRRVDRVAVPHCVTESGRPAATVTYTDVRVEVP